jgi:transposase
MSDKPRRKRRRWSEDFKRRVVAEASQAGVSAASVARRYELNDNLVFNWKRRYGADQVFLPVEVDTSASVPPALSVSARTSPAVIAGGRVEISLTDGTCITVNGAFDLDDVIQLVRGLS